MPINLEIVVRCPADAIYMGAMSRRRNREISDSVGECIDAASDLDVRHLADRDGLSIPAAHVLNRLEREGPMRLTLLAALEGVSQPAMTQLVTRLAAQELLERSCDPEDGRASLVAIARPGRDLLALRTAMRRRRLDDLISALPAEGLPRLQLTRGV